ncbi:MAG: putative signal peptide protein [Herbaspirillum sp.]|nr:putative signal peptide protein [Herbaspirillum sp.]
MTPSMMTSAPKKACKPFLAGALLLAILGIYGDAAAAAANLTAEQIVQKNITARGGLQAWKDVHSMTVTGLMDAGRLRSAEGMRLADPRKSAFNIRNANAQARSGGSMPAEAEQGKVVQLPFAMELMRPRKMRLELQFQGQTAIQVYDGAHGWKLRPFLGRTGVESFNQEELAIAAQQQELDGFLIDHAAKGSRVDLAGQEAVEGHNTYKLKLTLKSGDVRYLWVDAGTFLEARVDGVRKIDGKPKTTMTYFRDYKPLNGLLFPHVFETRVEGDKDSQRIVVEHVALNPPIIETRFAKPTQ